VSLALVPDEGMVQLWYHQYWSVSRWSL